jgi:predicted acylesterase/phospholipase RssA
MKSLGGGSPKPKAPSVETRRPNPPHLPKIYDAIVFSSGGARGIAHLGALAELEPRYDMSQTRLFIGTSAGAIAACIACLGLRARDVFDACVVPFKYEKQFKLHLLTQAYGLDKGESLEKFIASIVPHDLTFRDVYRDTGNVLSMIGTDITTSSMAVFDPVRTPDMTLRHALRISCSIPFLFTAVEHEGHIYVDGALTSAFPVSVAVDVYGCKDILGINFEEYSSTVSGTSMTFEEYISTIVDTVVYSNSKHRSFRGVSVDVCTIEMAGDVNGIAFDMTEEQKRDIYTSGCLSMRVFIHKKISHENSTTV